MTEHADAERRLAEIEAREKAAPGGPWRTYPNPMRTDGVFVGQDKPPTYYEGKSILPSGEIGHMQEAVPRTAWSLGCQVEHAPADFIAHARTDIPWLVAELRAAWAENNRLRDLVPALVGTARETAADIATESYRRGLAAAKAAVKGYMDRNMINECAGDVYYDCYSRAMALIDALLAQAAAAPGEEEKKET